MTQANLLSVEDLIKELGAGRATVKFILERFNPWLASERIGDARLYFPAILPLLVNIQDMLSSGMLPSQIEEFVEKDILAQQSQVQENSGSNGDIRMNREAISFIQDMVKDIQSQQERIASAHEKRAEAEERKAAAIEKRAEAEEKKAAAMNNIASALQEMSQLRVDGSHPVDGQSIEIASQAANALTMDQAPELKPDLPEENWDEDFEDPLADLESLLDDPPSGPVEDNPEPASFNTVDQLLDDEFFKDDIQEDDVLGEIQVTDTMPDEDVFSGLESDNMDDLALLVDEPGISDGDIDDLSALIDTVSISDPRADTDLDELLDGELLPESPPMDLDDLSLLVDNAEPYEIQEPDLDDLSSLLQPDTDNELDDLSLLVAPKADNDIDDLSALIDTPSAKVANQEEAPLDDLSMLVDPAPTLASLKPDIRPEDDLAQYKATVMKIIIGLKKEGLTAEETTDRLNNDEVATLSGKPEWSKNAIVKIYGFIDSVK